MSKDTSGEKKKSDAYIAYIKWKYHFLRGSLSALLNVHAHMWVVIPWEEKTEGQQSLSMPYMNLNQGETSSS